MKKLGLKYFKAFLLKLKKGKREVNLPKKFQGIKRSKFLFVSKVQRIKRYVYIISGSNKIDRSVRKFLEILALCHTVQVAPKRVTKSTKNLKVSLRDPGELAYNASRSVGLCNFKFGNICCCPALTRPNPKKIRLDQNVLKIHQFS